MKGKRNGQKQNKNLKTFNKDIMANTSAMWEQSAHTTYQLSSPNCKRGAVQKLTLNEKCFQSPVKKSQTMDHQQQNDKTEKARGLGRNATDETGK